MAWYLTITFSFAAAGMLVCIYYLKKGQFEDLEDVKYQMFREDEGED